MKTPKQVKTLVYEANCTCVSPCKIDYLMNGATPANKRWIDKLVKEHLPDLFDDLAIQYHNPYRYYKTKTHFILVHSGIEYFLKYEI